MWFYFKRLYLSRHLAGNGEAVKNDSAMLFLSCLTFFVICSWVNCSAISYVLAAHLLVLQLVKYPQIGQPFKLKGFKFTHNSSSINFVQLGVREFSQTKLCKLM